MKIAVLGAHGQLGKSIQNLEPAEDFDGQWTFYSSKKIDITDQQDIDGLFVRYVPDYIVNCAAYTAVDKAEEEPEKARKINADALGHLADACRKNGSILIHISTDFVFDGKADTPYKESDRPNPLGVYGQTKYEGEQLIAQRMKSYFILRTGWLYSAFNHNFYRTMRRLFEERDELQVISDQIGTPTHTAVLAKAIFMVIASRSGAYGLYHVANEGQTSWYGFASEILRLSKSQCRLNPVSTEEYPSVAQRPRYSVLDKTKFRAQFGVEFPDWKKSLKAFF